MIQFFSHSYKVLRLSGIPLKKGISEQIRSGIASGLAALQPSAQESKRAITWELEEFYLSNLAEKQQKDAKKDAKGKQKQAPGGADDRFDQLVKYVL